MIYWTSGRDVNIDSIHDGLLFWCLHYLPISLREVDLVSGATQRGSRVRSSLVMNNLSKGCTVSFDISKTAQLHWVTSFFDVTREPGGGETLCFSKHRALWRYFWRFMFLNDDTLQFKDLRNVCFFLTILTLQLSFIPVTKPAFNCIVWIDSFLDQLVCNPVRKKENKLCCFIKWYVTQTNPWQLQRNMTWSPRLKALLINLSIFFKENSGYTKHTKVVGTKTEHATSEHWTCCSDG